MKILLANIGNRNLKYNDKLFIDLNLEERFQCLTFRDFTNKLLDEYELQKEYISQNILPDLIDYLNQGIDKVYLFYTDTPEGDRNDQDTLYAAEIVAKKLQKKYPSIAVELNPIKCKPTDTDALMQRYRMYLRKMANNPELTYVYICESGGTPQQKTGLRIVSEFVFNADYLKSYTVEVGNDKNIIVREQPSVEYKNVIVEEQVSALAYMGEFSSALNLYKLKNTSPKNKPLVNTLELANALMSNNVQNAINIASSNFLGKAIVDPFIKEQIQGLTLFTQQYNKFSTLLTKNNYLSACIILSIADWKYETQQYGEASLFYSIFIENVLTSLINNAAQGFEVDGYGEKFHKFVQALNNGIIFTEFKLPETLDVGKLNSANVPFKIAVAEAINDPISRAIIQEIKLVNSFYRKINNAPQTFGIDNLRNKYAHEGKLIKESDFSPFVEFGYRMQEIFQLPSTSIFNQIVQLIYDIMV
jgi:hypothetical protein